MPADPVRVATPGRVGGGSARPAAGIVGAVSAGPAPLAGSAVPRPWSVTAAAFLLYAAALDLLVLAVLTAAYLPALRTAARLSYDSRADADQLVSSATTGSVASIAGLLVFAAVLSVCATFDLRGSRLTRLSSWTAAGVGVLCCGGSGLIDRYGGDPVTPLAYPEWYRSLHGWLVVGLVLALAVAAALLALPPAHRYFQPRLVPAAQ